VLHNNNECVNTQIWQVWVDRLDRWSPTTGLVKLLKRQFGLHYWTTLVVVIKIHIWNVQFWLRMREVWLQEDLHIELTGQTGSVNYTGFGVYNPHRSCISTWNLLGFRSKSGKTSPPYKYKEPRLNEDTFISLAYFSDPSCCFPTTSAASEDVLAGLPKLGQPKVRLTWGSPSVGVRWSSAGEPSDTSLTGFHYRSHRPTSTEWCFQALLQMMRLFVPFLDWSCKWSPSLDVNLFDMSDGITFARAQVQYEISDGSWVRNQRCSYLCTLRQPAATEQYAQSNRKTE
jgi:hypothetical protein